MIIGTLQDYCTAKERISMQRIKLSKTTKERIETFTFGLALFGLWILALSICAHIK